MAFTSYHALDGRSLLEMSGAAGAAASSDVVQKLRARVEATESELHSDLFDQQITQAKPEVKTLEGEFNAPNGV